MYRALASGGGASGSAGSESRSFVRPTHLRIRERVRRTARPLGFFISRKSVCQYMCRLACHSTAVMPAPCWSRRHGTIRVVALSSLCRHNQSCLPDIRPCSVGPQGGEYKHPHAGRGSKGRQHGGRQGTAHEVKTHDVVAVNGTDRQGSLCMTTVMIAIFPTRRSFSLGAARQSCVYIIAYYCTPQPCHRISHRPRADGFPSLLSHLRVLQETPKCARAKLPVRPQRVL